jgi:hypothetical protein
LFFGLIHWEAVDINWKFQKKYWWNHMSSGYQGVYTTEVDGKQNILAEIYTQSVTIGY